MSPHTMWYRMAMTTILQVPLYMNTMMPSTGNGSHAIITIVYALIITMLRYYNSADGGGLASDWVDYTHTHTPPSTQLNGAFPRNLGLFQTIIGLFYNIQAESTFRKLLRP